MGKLLTSKADGKNYDWKKKVVTYKKEPLVVDLKRIYNPLFKEYELKLEEEAIGYISQGEDGTYTPFLETYDEEGRLTESNELYDASHLNTAIIRIVRHKKGDERYNYKNKAYEKREPS